MHFYDGFLGIYLFFRNFATQTNELDKIMAKEQRPNTKVIRNEKFGGERPLVATHD